MKGETLRIKIYEFKGRYVIDIVKDYHKHGMYLTAPITAEEYFDDIIIDDERQ